MSVERSARRPTSGDDEYRVAPGIWRPMGRSRILFRSELTDASVVLETRLAELAQGRRHFTPLVQHAVEAFSEGLHQLRVSRLRRAVLILGSALRALAGQRRAHQASHLSVGGMEKQLEGLAASGVLVGQREILDRVRDSAEEPAGYRGIDVVAVLTGDRPDTLARCLRSYVEHHRASPGPVEHLIIDDSSSDARVAETQQAAGLLTAAVSMSTSCVTRRGRQALAERLAAETDVDPSLLRFALCGDRSFGFAAGASRNALLLLTAGRRVFSMDDDTLWEPRLPRHYRAKEHWAVDSSFDPKRRQAFVGRESALDATAPADVDILAQHARVLGCDVGACLSSQRIHIDGANDRALADLWHERGTILTSTNGVVGHSGVAWPMRTFESVPDAERPILRSRSLLAAAVETQAVVSQVARPTLSNGAYCSSMFLGLDNTSMLPPFLPSLRSEDVLFGRLLRFCRPEAYAADLPFLMVHDPPQNRSVSLSSLVEHASVEFYYLLGDLLESVDVTVGRNTATRMRVLGTQLVDLGVTDEDEFREVCRLQFLRRSAARLERIEHGLLAARNAPSLWVESARRHLQALRAAVVSDDAWIPFDLRDGRTAQEAVGLAQTLATRFGHLLTVWPTVWEAAGRTNRCGTPDTRSTLLAL